MELSTKMKHSEARSCIAPTACLQANLLTHTRTHTHIHSHTVTAVQLKKSVPLPYPPLPQIQFFFFFRRKSSATVYPVFTEFFLVVCLFAACSGICRYFRFEAIKFYRVWRRFFLAIFSWWLIGVALLHFWTSIFRLVSVPWISLGFL